MIIQANRNVVIFYLNDNNRVITVDRRIPWESSVDWTAEGQFTKAAPMEYVKWLD